MTGVKLKLAEDLVEATSDAGAYVQLSVVIKRTAVKLPKICSDLRLLASGPACRIQRDQPATVAARIVDYAGQGQSGGT